MTHFPHFWGSCLRPIKWSPKAVWAMQGLSPSLSSSPLSPLSGFVPGPRWAVPPTCGQVGEGLWGTALLPQGRVFRGPWSHMGVFPSAGRSWSSRSAWAAGECPGCGGGRGGPFQSEGEDELRTEGSLTPLPTTLGPGSPKGRPQSAQSRD